MERGGLVSNDGTVWNEACRALRGELGEAAYGSYLAPASLRRGRGGRLVLVTPTGFARDWLRRNAWPRIGEVWRECDPQHRPLGLVSRAEFESEVGVVAEEGAPALAAVAASSAVIAHAAAPVAAPAADGLGDPVRPRSTFETFVPSPTNEFALSVARQVGAWTAQSFNPVVFHGPTGWGKTHLLNAIAVEAQRRRPGAKVVILSAERFLTTFVRAVVDRSSVAFKDELRRADLLLVDDVQFIGGKKAAQEELLHTLAALMGEGKRVVFAADKPPGALSEIDSRLRSHLQSGLTCGIERGDQTLRLGVIDRKLKLLAGELGCQDRLKPEVATLLADRFADNVRELEGGLNILVARVGERLNALGLDEATTLLRPHLKGADRRITVDEIQKAACEHFGLKQVDLLSQRRTRAVARPRQVAMYLAKTLTTRSYPDIGRRFGGRDHTTVIHAVRQIERLKAEDPAIASDVETLTAKLRG
jgi:chromosomal replication initiator protein